MVTYIDKTDKPVKLGDILWYDEGSGGSKSVQTVVEHKGELAGKTIIYNRVENVQHANRKSTWAKCPDAEEPVELCFYMKGDAKLIDATVIGSVDDNPEMLTIEYVEKTYKL